MLKLEDEARKRLWDIVVAEVERYAAGVDSYPINPQDAWTKIQEEVARFDAVSNVRSSEKLNPKKCTSEYTLNLTSWRTG